MQVKKSKEQLIKDYAEIGVDYNKFTKYGELNVIVQSLALDKDNDGNEIGYLNFMPHRGYVSEQSVALADEY